MVILRDDRAGLVKLLHEGHWGMNTWKRVAKCFLSTNTMQDEHRWKRKLAVHVFQKEMLTHTCRSIDLEWKYRSSSFCGSYADLGSL